MSRIRYRVGAMGAKVTHGFPPDSLWRGAEVGVVQHFHPRSSDHRPQTQFRIVADNEALYLRFDVSDRFVRCSHVQAQAMVCEDSCVEFFVQPAQCGYLNFEFSAIGTILCYHITNPAHSGGHFAAYRPLCAEELSQVSIRTSLQGPIREELSEAISWWLMARVPYSLLAVAGGRRPESGCIWRASVYKCGDKTSHPHWASWSIIGEKLDFHQPERFGDLEFELPV